MRQSPQRPQPSLNRALTRGCSQWSEKARAGLEWKSDVDSQAHLPALPSLWDPDLTDLPTLTCLPGFKQNIFLNDIQWV